MREDQLIASGLRFVQWRHASPNIDARKKPKNNPTARVYQHLEDELTRAGAGNEGILALTTTREGAQNLRNYVEIAWKTANAETAVKVAGATAKHCIVTHGESTFLSGEGCNLDYDQECFTRANVAYSRATNLTILACPLNMQGMPGALQVLAALLHGVQSIDTYDDWEPVIRGSLDLTPIQVEKATTAFHQALLPHQLWSGPLPVCPAEHHQGKARRLQKQRYPACRMGHISREARLSMGLSMDMQSMRCPRRNGLSSQTDNSPDIGGYSTIALAVANGAV